MNIASHHRRPWVLVVDDHDLSRQFTVQALRQITHRVKQAGTGREGLELATLFRPELIFLDLHLPDMDGVSLLEQIRVGWPADSPEPDFVILSGVSRVDARNRFDLPEDIVMVSKPARRRDIEDLASRRLAPDHSVRESTESSSTRAPTTVLHELFLNDMEKQCPLLDEHISGIDWQSARAVLHQMIAASAICGEADVERDCRLLTEEIGNECRPKTLSEVYFGLLRSIDRSRHGIQT